MGSAFRRNVVTTSGFFALRFAITLVVAIAYILVAAMIQYAFVGILGESTFNYIVGGLLSLFLGVLVCNFLGSLLFMFVRGWHVAALAYANKIRKAHAPAITVGMKAFAKNIVGFGAVYGVRTIAKNLLADFKDSLWELLKDVPFAQNLQQVAENPIVEKMAGDVLNYGFDATIFYLIKHPPEDINDVPSTVIEGLKRYLCCLPSIMFTSISSYLLFGVVPQVLKILLIVFVFLTQGFIAGVLITVLMWPLFYILENAFFRPLTMIMFISCFSEKCDEEIDPESETAKFVEAVLDGVNIGTTADDLDDGEEATPGPEAEQQQSTLPDGDVIIDAQPDMSDLEGPEAAPVMQATTPPSGVTSGVSQGWMRDVNAPGGRIPTEPDEQLFGGLTDLAGMPLADDPSSASPSPPPPGYGSSAEFESLLSGLKGEGPLSPRAPIEEKEEPSSLSSIFGNLSAKDLGAPYGEPDSDEDDSKSSGPSIQDILSGGDFL